MKGRDTGPYAPSLRPERFISTDEKLIGRLVNVVRLLPPLQRFCGAFSRGVPALQLFLSRDKRKKYRDSINKSEIEREENYSSP